MCKYHHVKGDRSVTLIVLDNKTAHRLPPVTCLIPLGLLIFVDSISTQLRMGETHKFARPGNCTVLSNLSMVISRRHCLSGFSWIAVSSISIGTESVAISSFFELPRKRSDFRIWTVPGFRKTKRKRSSSTVWQVLKFLRG